MKCRPCRQSLDEHIFAVAKANEINRDVPLGAAWPVRLIECKCGEGLARSKAAALAVRSAGGV